MAAANNLVILGDDLCSLDRFEQFLEVDLSRIPKFTCLKEFRNGISAAEETTVFICGKFLAESLPGNVGELKESFPKSSFILMAEPGQIKCNDQLYELGFDDYLVKEQFDELLLDKTLRIARERKELNFRLAEYNEIYEMLFHNTPLAKIIFHPHSNKIYDANQQALKLYGYTREEMLEIKIDDLWSPNKSSSEKAIYDTLIDHNEAETGVHQTKEGESRVVEVYTSNFSYQNLALKHATIRDITSEVCDREEINKLSLVASKSNNAVIITDENERIEWVNPAFERTFGYKLEEVKGRKPSLLQGEGTSRKTLDKVRRQLDSLRPFDFEVLNYKKDNTPVYIQMSVTPVVDEHGKVKQFVSVGRDITDEKRQEAEEELFGQLSSALVSDLPLHRQLEKVLARLNSFINFDVAEAWLTSLDKKRLTLVAQNHRTARGKRFALLPTGITHVSKGEGLPGITWEKEEGITLEELSEESGFMRWRQAREAGLKVASSIPIYANGEIIAVFVFLNTHLHSYAGNSNKILTNLSTRIGSELKRSKSETELQTFFELSPELLCIIGADGYFKRINKAFTRVLGYSREELLSRPFMDFMHPEDRARTKDRIEQLYKEKVGWGFENRYIAKDGKVKHISWTATVYEKENLVFGIGREVTREKELEQERSEHLQAIEEQNEKLREIAWTQSHVVRAPLARLMGLTEILQQEPENSQENSYIFKQIASSAGELDQIISEMVRTSTEVKSNL